MAINPHTKSRIDLQSHISRNARLGVRVKKTHKGFALLVAVIFMSVMLTFGLALGSLAYKQEILASSALESQYAFYAADAGLECALYADQKLNTFDYDSHGATNPPTLITCDSVQATPLGYSYTVNQLVVRERLSLDSTRCADIAVYKPKPNTGGTTYVFSQGYDVSCDTLATNPPRLASRGIEVHYK
ncbi:MAG: pilus assembly PilX family protein [Minisyncoccota bacterium]